MRKAAVLFIAVLFCLTAANAVFAEYDPEWSIDLQTLGQYGGYMTSLRTGPSCSDSIASEDEPPPSFPPEYPEYTCYIVSVVDGSYYVRDARSSFKGKPITWNLELISDYVGDSSGYAYIGARNPSWLSSYQLRDFDSRGGERIDLYRMTDTGRELLWSCDPSSNDWWYSSVAYDVHTKFQLEVTATPEPSSILAILSGLAGTCGVFIRRRKK